MLQPGPTAAPARRGKNRTVLGTRMTQVAGGIIGVRVYGAEYRWINDVLLLSYVLRGDRVHECVIRMLGDAR